MGSSAQGCRLRVFDATAPAHSQKTGVHSISTPDVQDLVHGLQFRSVDSCLENSDPDWLELDTVMCGQV